MTISGTWNNIALFNAFSLIDIEEPSENFMSTSGVSLRFIISTE